jgi:hypothetical protein
MSRPFDKNLFYTILAIFGGNVARRTLWQMSAELLADATASNLCHQESSSPDIFDDEIRVLTQCSVFFIISKYKNFLRV